MNEQTTALVLGLRVSRGKDPPPNRRLRDLLGLPFQHPSDEGNELTPNSCSCRRPMQVVEYKTQEYGVRAFELVEYKAFNYRDFRGAKVNR